MWRVSKHILPTRCWLEQKGVAPDADCLLCHCHNDMESQDHLFMHCQVIRSFWFMSPLGLYVLINMHLSQRMLQWLSNPNLQVTQLFSLSLWTIQKMRNDVVFNKKSSKPYACCSQPSRDNQEFRFFVAVWECPTTSSYLLYSLSLLLSINEIIFQSKKKV